MGDWSSQRNIVRLCFVSLGGQTFATGTYNEYDGPIFHKVTAKAFLDDPLSSVNAEISCQYTDPRQKALHLLESRENIIQQQDFGFGILEGINHSKF